MKLVMLMIVLLIMSFSINGQDNFKKIKNLENLANESIVAISYLDSNHVMITSGGAFDENQPYNYNMINRKFNIHAMNVSWKKYFTHKFNIIDSPKKITINTNKNFIITGSSKHKDAFELGLDRGNSFSCEMTPEGEVLWSSIVGENNERDWGVDITEIEDGGYAIAGWKYQNENSVISDAVLRKIDSQGDSIWTRYFEVNDTTIYGNNKGISVVKGSFNSIYYIYHKKSTGWAKQIFTIAHVDGHTGDIYWEKDYDFGVTSTVYDADMTDDYNIRIMGHIRWVNAGGCVTPAIWEINNSGDIVYEKNFQDEIGCTFGDKFSRTNDGGYAFTVNDGQYPKLIKLDSEYNVEWMRTYEIEQGMSPKGVVQMPNGDYIIAGYEGATAEYTIWVLKVNENGELVSISTELKVDNEIKVFPNPVKHLLNIESTDKDRLSMRLINILGVEILNCSNCTKLDLSGLQPQNYFLTIYKNEKRIGIEKITKI